MASHNNLGRSGEKVAEEYLLAKGHLILERNWHSSHKELDLISEWNGWLVVSEVKTRTENRWESPESAISPLKIKRIVQAAHHYVRLYGIDLPVRFDVLSVIHENGAWIIEHFEDAFLPPHK